MAAYERTRKNMRNSIVALLLQVVAMLVGFFARKIFIDYLGTEVLGLNTTATSILNCLNLAELGVWSAIAVTLYKPLYDGDREKVREIVALQGWLYRLIATVIIVGSLIVMLFFPQIFSKSLLPAWYPYATFGALLYSSLLGYFFNYKKNVLYADQKDYKALLCSRSVNLVKLVCQALAVRFMENGYVWWLILEVVFATINTIFVAILVDRNYPYLREPVGPSKLLRAKYPEVIQKIKFLSVHKLSYFALNQISPIIIYAYTTLTSVALYGNYILLTTNLGNIINAIFAGTEAGVGNMVAEGDKKLILKVFREFFTTKMFIVSTCCICLWILTEPFISVWLGGEYILGKTTLALIIAIFFITNTRTIVDTYLNTYGMFSDIWAPIFEAGVNILLSIILGSIYGINGILAGALISQIAIGFIWKPIFLFKWGLKEPLSYYIKLYAKLLAIIAVSFAAVAFLSGRIGINPSESLLSFLIYAIIVFLLTVCIFGGLLYASEYSFRGIFIRIRNSLNV
ncbi:MAG: sugar transporter [Bacteroidales bacterium]|nr:sugar transporter [Bacteroidales bacterium]